MTRRRAWVGLCAAAVLAAACGTEPAMPASSRAPATPRVAPPNPSLSPLASPPPTPTPAPTAASCSNSQVVSGWDLARRAAQLVVVPVDETAVASVAPSVAAGAGGIILFGTTAPANLGAGLRSLEAGAPDGIAPLVMTDEEGGGVQRMANLVGAMPWAAIMAETMSPAQVRALAARVARQMAVNGVGMDLAPVADLATGPGPDEWHTDGPRSFGLSAATTSTYALAFARGLQDGGVIPVVKHFPGEGAATANTDDREASTPPLAELESHDLLPFEAAIQSGLPAVMVGNASVPGLTGRPASVSPEVITGLLRDRLGFQGLVLTDSLSANALSDLGISVPEAAVEAVEAGADMVLFSSSAPNTTFSQVVQALASAVRQGVISETQLDAAVIRVLAVRGIDLCP
jgi:beta-N-acetylhexosaminidase